MRTVLAMISVAVAGGITAAGAGMAVKYFLDKKGLFKDETRDKIQDYTMLGTSILFVVALAIYVHCA